MFFLFTTLCAALATAARVGPARHGLGVPVPPVISNATLASIKHAYFDQLLDHSNPSLGTFKQKYWYNAEWWKGPGSPVVVFNPGEEDAAVYTAYCTRVTLTGETAWKIGGAAILIEHRYWGDSSPYKELTTANMTYLTLENSIYDMTYFAQNVKLPFANGTKSNAADVPWVLMGGSYSGALTAWVASVAPDVYWAYLSTSAPVQAISNFWQYFYEIQQGMPQNCSTDVTKVVDYMDGVLAKGNATEIHALKAEFGLAGVEHNDDFMEAIANAPYAWQEMEFFTDAGFHEWCDYVEDSVNQTNPAKLPGAGGVGLQKALKGYATYVKNFIVPDYCESFGYYKGKNNVECFNSYNKTSPLYTDVSLQNTYDRQWDWFLCNEPFGYWQDGAPANKPTIISRLINVDYYTRQCALWFPPGPQGQTYGIAKGKTEAQVNAYTKGWDFTNTTRLIYTNGQYDPWRSAGVASVFRPGGPIKAEPGKPAFLIPDGHHCYDLLIANGRVNPPLRKIQEAEVKQIHEWVLEWPGYKKGVSPKPREVAFTA